MPESVTFAQPYHLITWMIRHWLNELMNLVAGNSRYVQYERFWQLVFLFVLLFLLTVPGLLYFLT